MGDLVMRVDVAELRRALKVLRPAIRRHRDAHPVLGGVWITPAAGGVELAATDLELAIATRCETEGDAAGSGVVVDAEAFGVLARMLSKGPVLFEAADGELRAGTDGATHTLATIDPYGWAAPATPGGEPVVLGPGDLAQLRRVVPSASDDLARPVWCCVRLTGSKAMATDAKRLAIADLPAACLDGEVLIPARVVGLALRSKAPSLGLKVGDRHAAFDDGKTTWTGLVGSGEFPPVEEIVPRRSPHHWCFNTRELLTLAEAAPKLSEPVEIDVVGDTAEVLHTGAEPAMVRVDSNVDQRAVFTARFLRDVLVATTDEVVRFEFDADQAPGRQYTVRSGGCVQVLISRRW